MKIDKVSSATCFFVLQGWQFVSENYISLLDKLSAEDRRIFYFDVREIEWQSYITNYGLGIRRFIFREEDDTIPAARISLVKFYLMQGMTKGLFLMLLAFVVFQVFF